jgi:hypothetical protein
MNITDYLWIASIFTTLACLFLVMITHNPIIYTVFIISVGILLLTSIITVAMDMINV